MTCMTIASEPAVPISYKQLSIVAQAYATALLCHVAYFIKVRVCYVHGSCLIAEDCACGLHCVLCLPPSPLRNYGIRCSSGLITSRPHSNWRCLM